MATVSVTLPSDGTTADVADYNTPITTIVNEVNGNLDNANIKGGAAIATSKLADDAGITDAKISGVSSGKLSNPYKFSVYRNTAHTSSTTAARVQFDTKTFDTGSNVDIVTNKGRFTAPVAGFYYFTALAGNTVANAAIATFLYKNGSRIKHGNFFGTTTGSISEVSGLLQLAATDYVEAYFLGGNGSDMYTGADLCYFDGFMVSAT